MIERLCPIWSFYENVKAAAEQSKHPKTGEVFPPPIQARFSKIRLHVFGSVQFLYLESRSGECIFVFSPNLHLYIKEGKETQGLYIYIHIYIQIIYIYLDLYIYIYVDGYAALLANIFIYIYYIYMCFFVLFVYVLILSMLIGSV